MSHPEPERASVTADRSGWGATTTVRSTGGRSFRVFEPRPSSIRQVVDESVATWAGRDFMVQGARRLTFADLGASVEAVAAQLLARGVRSGDRVALLAANSPEWVAGFLGILYAGAVAVLGSGWWTEDDVEHALEVTGTSLVITDAPRARKVPTSYPTVDVRGLALDLDEPGAAPTASTLPAIGEDDPAIVVFTSGTTSRPKGAVLTHRSAVANLQNLLARTNQLPPLDPDRPQGVNLCAVPLFHISGVQTVLQHVVVGGRLVFLEGRFDAGEVTRLLEHERVTAWTAVPTMLALVLDHPDTPTRDLSSVRSLAVGGAPVPDGLLDRAHTVFTGATRRIALSYGSTEAGGTVATGLRDGSGMMDPLTTVEVAIGAPDDAGIGEVLVRSASVMECYLGVPDDEQPVDPDGWLHTGDLGELRDGRLRIVGRLKDIVIRGGENVSASAVECVLREHPKVADAAVVGLEHPTWGEEVCAAVQVRDGDRVVVDELRAFAAERLAHYAVPTRWWLIDTPLPVTETGKVSKVALRETFPPRDQREQFRSEVASWLEQQCPPTMRTPVADPADLVFGGRSGSFPSEDARVWLERMAGRGWTAPTWPVEYGGAGLSRAEASVLASELQRLGCRQPLISVHGIGMVGPVLLEHGSDEQCRRLLPPTARGELRWCQGFSEPAVGSDLASVLTRAVRDGDEYVVTGQKLWTSFAMDSDWIFVLARTDPALPKREGLGFFLVDLESPGISVRPIALLSGESEFCEVFFDDVRVPIENRVGDEGDGWGIARLVLQHERQMFGQGTGLMTQRLGTPDFVGLARAASGCAEGPLPDAIVRDAIASAEIALDCVRAALWRARHGDGALHPSVLKYTLSELMKHQADLAGRIAGTGSLGWSGAAFSDDELAATREYLFSKAWTIAGGSAEIQLNIIARRLLGLPHLGPEQD